MTTTELAIPHLFQDAEWQRCLESFLLQIKDRSGSRNSFLAYRTYLRLFFADGRDPGKVTRAHVLAFLQERSQSQRNRGAPIGASAKNARLTVLSSFYAHAAAYEICREEDAQLVPLYTRLSPTRGIRQLSVEKRPNSMSQEEFARFLSVIPSVDTPKGARDRSLFCFFYMTARRRLETLTLTVGDIQRGEILVDASTGETRSGWTFDYVPKGNSREKRRVELCDEVYQMLVHYWQVSGRKPTLTKNSPLWTALRPGSGRRERSEHEPLAASSVNELFKQYLKKASMSGWSIHSLRHSSARARLESGETVQQIQAVLGHKHTATTWGYLMINTPMADKGQHQLAARLKQTT
jgi:integrase